MRSFKDADGRDWDVEVTVGTIKRVRATLDLDLTEIDSAIYKRLADPVLLADLLFVVCERQANDRDLSDEDFGRGLRGDPIDDATAALLDAVADFFPGRRRSLLQAMISKSATLQEQAAKMAMDKITDPETEKATLAAMRRDMDAEVAGALTPSSGLTNSQASPASTPGRTP